MNTKTLDIIIPAYNTKDTLVRCLSSIAMQTIRDQVIVTIVNDCSIDGSYAEIINKFTDCMDVREIILEENQGPGLARQIGIDNTTAPYIMFLDSDDTLINAFTLQVLLQGMIQNEAYAVYGHYYVESEDGELMDSGVDTSTLHGKLYSRDFINKYHLHFTNLRMNEDASFQMRAHLLIQNLHLNYVSFDDQVMIYHYNKNGMAQVKNKLDTIKSWITSLIEIVEYIDKKSFTSMTEMKLRNFISMYLNYNYILQEDEVKDYAEEFLNICQNYYTTYVTKLKPVSWQWEQLYVEAMRHYSIDGELIKLPVITFNAFIKLVQGE